MTWWCWCRRLLKLLRRLHPAPAGPRTMFTFIVPSSLPLHSQLEVSPRPTLHCRLYLHLTSACTLFQPPNLVFLTIPQARLSSYSHPHPLTILYSGIMPPTIHEFPAEVLRLVLKNVQTDARRDRSGAFLHATTTCRRWSQVCVSLLWTDINLAGIQLFRFTSCNIAQSNAQLVRSLTIKVPVYTYTNPTSSAEHDEPAVLPCSYTKQDIEDALGSLAQKLGVMAYLECFSIVVPVVRNGVKLTSVDRRSLLAILQAVPSSVRHLELETNNLSHLDSDESARDLCPVLRELMARLSNLRLRVGHLCPNLFAPMPKPIRAMTPDKNSEVARKTIIISAIPASQGPFRPI